MVVKPLTINIGNTNRINVLYCPIHVLRFLQNQELFPLLELNLSLNGGKDAKSTFELGAAAAASRPLRVARRFTATGSVR
jgi:hypothetical protein